MWVLHKQVFTERESDRARDEAFPEPFPNSTGCHDQGCIFYQGLPARLLSQPYPLPKHKYGGSESERLGECRESWGDTKWKQRMEESMIWHRSFVRFTQQISIQTDCRLSAFFFFKGWHVMSAAPLWTLRGHGLTLLQEMNTAASLAVLHAVMCASLLARTACAIVIDAPI